MLLVLYFRVEPGRFFDSMAEKLEAAELPPAVLPRWILLAGTRHLGISSIKRQGRSLPITKGMQP